MLSLGFERVFAPGTHDALQCGLCILCYKIKNDICMNKCACKNCHLINNSVTKPHFFNSCFNI